MTNQQSEEQHIHEMNKKMQDMLAHRYDGKLYSALSMHVDPDTGMCYARIDDVRDVIMIAKNEQQITEGMGVAASALGNAFIELLKKKTDNFTLEPEQVKGIEQLDVSSVYKLMSCIQLEESLFGVKGEIEGVDGFMIIARNIDCFLQWIEHLAIVMYASLISGDGQKDHIPPTDANPYIRMELTTADLSQEEIDRISEERKNTMQEEEDEEEVQIVQTAMHVGKLRMHLTTEECDDDSGAVRGWLNDDTSGICYAGSMEELMVGLNKLMKVFGQAYLEICREDRPFYPNAVLEKAGLAYFTSYGNQINPEDEDGHVHHVITFKDNSDFYIVFHSKNEAVLWLATLGKVIGENVHLTDGDGEIEVRSTFFTPITEEDTAQ